MITYSKIFIHSFLVLCFLPLCSMEDIKYLPKDIIRDMITKYPIDENSVYLIKLLSLSKDNIKNKFNKNLSKYHEYREECANPRYHHSIDFTETKGKINRINTILNVFRRRFGKETLPYKNLLTDLKIQKNFLESYEISLHNDQLSHRIDIENKNYTLTKMTLILEALYLTTTSSKEDLQQNKQLFKKLSLQFHPDKINNLNEATIKEYQSFFTTFQPLLSADENSNRLNHIIESIRKKRNDTREQINNPPALTCAAHFFCSTALPSIGEGLGIALCNKTFAKLMPSSARENDTHNACITAARKTALEIETKLVKLSHRPQ